MDSGNIWVRGAVPLSTHFVNYWKYEAFSYALSLSRLFQSGPFGPGLIKGEKQNNRSSLFWSRFAMNFHRGKRKIARKAIISCCF